MRRKLYRNLRYLMFDHAGSKKLDVLVEYSWGTERENLGAFVWTNGRSRQRAGGCQGRRIPFCMRCAAFGSRPASGSTAESKRRALGFWRKMNINEARNYWGAFSWPNGRSRPRGGRRRGRGIRFYIRWAASGSRPASSSTTGSKKLGFWCNIHEAQNAKTWGRSFGRTGGRGSEPAGAGDGEFLFVCGAPHLVRVRRRVRPRNRKEAGFLAQNEY